MGRLPGRRARGPWWQGMRERVAGLLEKQQEASQKPLLSVRATPVVVTGRLPALS